MDFWQAIKEMDKGKVVQMCVNPERYYRLASDGCTIVNKPIREDWAYKGEEYGGEWRNAIFTSTHIRGSWMVVGEWRDGRIY